MAGRSSVGPWDSEKGASPLRRVGRSPWQTSPSPELAPLRERPFPRAQEEGLNIHTRGGGERVAQSGAGLLGERLLGRGEWCGAWGLGRTATSRGWSVSFVHRLRSFGSPFILFGFQTALQSCPLLLVCVCCFSLLLPLAFRKDSQELSGFLSLWINFFLFVSEDSCLVQIS